MEEGTGKERLTGRRAGQRQGEEGPGAAEVREHPEQVFRPQ